VGLIVVYAGLMGIFQAGLDLVFFDELMKTVPPEYSATFVSLAQSLQYLSAALAPIAGTILADQIGIAGGLMMSAALRLVGFGLFAWKGKVSLWPTPTPAVKAQFKGGESREG
jgi:fucose permease